MKNRKQLPLLFYVLGLILILNWLFGIFSGLGSNMSYSQVVDLFEEEQVRSFVVQNDTIYLELHTPLDGKTQVSAPLADAESFRAEMHDLLRQQKEAGILENYDFAPEKGFSAFDLIVPLLLVGFVLLFLWAMLMGRMNTGSEYSNMGKARATIGLPEGNKVTFADVAGADEEKAELAEVVDFLRNPKKYTDIGAKIPRGILLAGPPGTGKTLLARAVAGESDVQFLSMSGSEFAEMLVGVGASRVRDLFAQARRMAPAIIFIDEIDALARRRSSSLNTSHDEQMTLNQLLVEMDGFTRNEGIIVLAATNRADVLDPALLRPGRFDRQVYVGKPDVKDREEILKIHARDKRLDESVSLKTIARATVGFTGADLSNLLNEAAIMAARENRQVLNMNDVNEALMKIIAGPAKKTRLRNRRDLKTTAIHEAGHAVATHLLPTQDAVRHITIIPRGQSLGSTWTLPANDTSNMTRNEMYEEIVTLLGGRAAEDLFLGDISVGASSDIERATKLAKDMVARYGMCEKLGTVSYPYNSELNLAKPYSEKYAASIDDEVRALIEKAYAHCKQLLKENEGKLHQVTDYLLEHESMTGGQFAACMEGKEIGDGSDTAMFDGFEAET